MECIYIYIYIEGRKVGKGGRAERPQPQKSVLYNFSMYKLQWIHSVVCVFSKLHLTHPYLYCYYCCYYYCYLFDMISWCGTVRALSLPLPLSLSLYVYMYTYIYIYIYIYMCRSRLPAEKSERHNKQTHFLQSSEAQRQRGGTTPPAGRVTYWFVRRKLKNQ